MQQKLSFLLDRNRQFDHQSAQILDDLSLSLKNNAQNVPTSIIQSKEANEIWSALKEDHYFWYNAPKVLELCKVD